MRNLVSRFTSTNDFYPVSCFILKKKAERSKEFSGLSSLRSLKHVSDPAVNELLQNNSFQGISFEEWYNIFIMVFNVNTNP